MKPVDRFESSSAREVLSRITAILIRGIFFYRHEPQRTFYLFRSCLPLKQLQRNVTGLLNEHSHLPKARMPLWTSRWIRLRKIHLLSGAKPKWQYSVITSDCGKWTNVFGKKPTHQLVLRA